MSTRSGPMPYRCCVSRVVPLLALLLVSGCVPTAHPSRVTVSSLAGLQTAIDDAPAGETIILAPGVYRQARAIRIRGKHDLTISGATRDYADTVIRGPGIDDPGLQSNVRLNNADNITLENLTLRDSYDHGVQINNDSDRFTADNLRTLDNGESGFKITSPTHASGPAAYSDNGTIENCWIGFTTTGRRSVVEGVDIVAGNGWHLLGNHFVNIRRADGGPAYAAFAKGNAHKTVFADNQVENSFIGLSFGGGGTDDVYFRNADTRYETRGGVIRDNVIHDTDDAGIYLNKAHDFLVQGNTVLRNGPGTGAIESRFPGSSGIIRDNRVSGPIKTRDGGTARTEHNRQVPADTAAPHPNGISHE
ncbi:right-handed parallel beta-helix repeat-containing protein [Salinisphaera sp. RV14]|uniref:right-handed parallel beta-helix repeat-containing protein n=1 Tax=unclassified Salinisphaera TaxID=2649847 RepID=UPI003F830915